MKKIIVFLSLFVIIFNVYGVENAQKDYIEATNKLNTAYDKFSGGCTREEKAAIVNYAKRDFNNLSGGFDLFKTLTTDSGFLITDICANYAEDLYKTLVSTKTYIDKNTIYSIKLETDYEMKKNAFVNGSKILSKKDATYIDDCHLIDSEFVEILNQYLGYIQVALVSLTIILCMVDLYKVFISKESNDTKVFKKMSKRVIALIVVLLAPTIINIIIDLINRYVSIDALNCLES